MKKKHLNMLIARNVVTTFDTEKNKPINIYTYHLYAAEGNVFPQCISIAHNVIFEEYAQLQAFCYGFVENEDYARFDKIIETLGGRTIDYWLNEVCKLPEPTK